MSNIQESCGGCFEKQVQHLERAGERRTVLCPMLALLALKSDHRTPLVERHFLNLAEECVTETHGAGGLYKIQQVQGARAAEALVAIHQATPAAEQDMADSEQITVLNTGEQMVEEFAA